MSKNFLILVFLMVFGESLFAANSAEGTLIYVKGTVRVDKKTAEANQKVTLGQTVSTEEKSLAIIDFNGKIKLKIKEKSEIKLEAISQLDEAPSNFTLTAGQVIVNVLKKVTEKDSFVLKTPSAAMGVRGTTFFAAITPQSEWMCVQEGTVVVTTKLGSSTVPAGKGVFINDKKLDTPKAYLWTKKINWNLDQVGKMEDDLDLNNLYDPREALYD